MAKIYLEVMLPAKGATYEFSLDDRTTVEQAKLRMMDEIAALENEALFADAASTMLCSYAQKQPLAEAETIRGAGITSGELLLLV